VSKLSLPIAAVLALGLATSHLHGEPITVSRATPIREITSSRFLQCAPRADEGPLAAGIFFGDHIATAAEMRTAVRDYAQRYGAPPRVVKTFYSLADDFSADGRAGQVLRALREIPGVTPMVSLEPTWRGSPDTGLLELITSGQADARLGRAAHDLAALGPAPLLIELAAEMNATFGAPWQAAANGKDTAPAAFVDAWRHVVGTMRRAGAHNVQWVFAPSAGNPHTHVHSGPSHWAWYGHWYPGDAYVDYLGLHAFNNALAQGAWVPFIELVAGDAADRMLDDMIERFPHRRIFLGEFATSEHPHHAAAKARWIEDAYRRMQRCSAIAGVVWFDMDKEADWHIDSSRASAVAYHGAVRAASAGPFGG